MKTNNYQFDLMHQGQEQKDVIYNETVLKIDSMLNLNVLSLKEAPPQIMTYGEKYLITGGDHKNKICYFAHESKGTQYISPQNNMIIYLMSDDCFMKFTENEWQKTITIAEQKFVGTSNDFVISGGADQYCLYLSGNTSLTLNATRSFLLIIKQNHQNIFDIKWPDNILWPKKLAAKITDKINAIDCFRFHKLPESNHFLAEVLGQNYKY